MIQLFQYPHETLLQTSTAWSHGDSIQGYNDIEKFEDDYIKLMLDEKGMGLAANQVGIQKHAIIWNPQIKNFSKEKVVDVEGCLSFKGIWLKVERPRTVEVEYETTKGTKQTARLDGMESKCFQHECDHLDGVTFNQRVSKLRWDMARKK